MSYSEDYCEYVDYFLVQEGDDLARLSDEGLGVHYTDAEGLRRMMTEGIGSPRDYFFDHEYSRAVCLLDGDGWARVQAAGGSDAAVEREFFKQFSEPRSIWFAPDIDYEGETASPSGIPIRTLIDLEGLGDWLGENVEAWCFGDDAGGYGIYWSGPPAPSRFVQVDEEYDG